MDAIYTARMSAYFFLRALLQSYLVVSLYRTYFRPSASGAEIVKVSHYFICFWAVWMGAWATIVSSVLVGHKLSYNEKHTSFTKQV